MRQSFTKMVKKLWKERQQVVMMKLSDQVLTGTSRSLMEDSGHWVGVDRDLAPATTASCCQIQTASRLAVHDDNKQLQCESKKRPCGLLFISSSIIDHELAKFWTKICMGFLPTLQMHSIVTRALFDECYHFSRILLRETRSRTPNVNYSWNCFYWMVKLSALYL